MGLSDWEEDNVFKVFESKWEVSLVSLLIFEELKKGFEDTLMGSWALCLRIARIGGTSRKIGLMHLLHNSSA
jgi:hypothetical protein